MIGMRRPPFRKEGQGTETYTLLKTPSEHFKHSMPLHAGSSMISREDRQQRALAMSMLTRRWPSCSASIVGTLRTFLIQYGTRPFAGTTG